MKLFYLTIFNEPNDKFISIVGLSKADFYNLLHKVETYMRITSIHGLHKDASQGGRALQLDERGRLLLTLIWMRQYSIETYISWTFQLHVNQVHSYAQSTLEVLYTCLKGSVCFPDVTTRLDQGANLRGRSIVVVIDGTEQQILKPSNSMNEKLVYSGKKKNIH